MTISPIFATTATTLRQRSPSPVFAATASALRQRSVSPVFQATASYTVSALRLYAVDITTGQNTPMADGDTLVYTDGNPYLEGVKQLLSTTTNIDATATGATALYTVPTGKRVLVAEAVVVVTVATAVTVPITAGIGVAAGEDDIVASTQLTNLLTMDQSYSMDIDGSARIAAAGEVINFGIDTAITGTAQSLDVYLFGIQDSV